MGSERSGSDTFVWAAILDSSHPYTGSAVALPTALPDTLTAYNEFILKLPRCRYRFSGVLLTKLNAEKES